MAMQLVIVDLNGSHFAEDGIYEVKIRDNFSCFITDEHGEYEVSDLICDGVSFVVKPASDLTPAT
ncbi:TPA: hypothetical protein ACMY33_001285 [Yersinia enterocolitica]|nr:hypothetical protein [Yersinia enterocolitica]